MSAKGTPEETRQRIRELEAELARLGDDIRATRRASIAHLTAQLGEVVTAAELYLAAARHCMTTGQALRAAVLARMANRTAPLTTAAYEAALAIWRQCSGEPDTEFHSPNSAN